MSKTQVIESKGRHARVVPPTPLERDRKIVVPDDDFVLSPPGSPVAIESCHEPLLARAPLLKLMRLKLKGMQQVRTTFANASNATTSSAGLINLVIANTTLPTLTEFSNYATIFDEFFVHGFQVDFLPYDRYLALVATTPGTNHTSTPCISVSLQHGVSGYTTMAFAYSNESAKPFMTSDASRHVWKNTESVKTPTVINPTGSAVATQGWCLTASAPASLYTGTVQYINSVQIGNGLGAIQIGQFFVKWDVSFRIRA